jgi:hypothetical protein
LKVEIHNKSARCFGALFFATIAFAIPDEGMASSLESSNLNIEVGISSMRFKYEEFEDGRVIDKEQGTLPGMSFRLGQRLADWEWEGSASSFYGQLPYTGEDSNHVPYNTRTDETIGDISLRLGHWFGKRYPVMPYAGIGYRRWDRDILPNSLAGLFESYRWQYAWVGSKIFTYQDNTSQFLLDVGLLKPLHPELRMGSGSTVLHLESRTGLRAMLTWSLKLKGSGHNDRLVIEPWYEYWNMGRSPEVPYGIYNIHEPDSKTHNFGFNLRFAWTM